MKLHTELSEALAKRPDGPIKDILYFLLKELAELDERLSSVEASLAAPIHGTMYMDNLPLPSLWDPIQRSYTVMDVKYPDTQSPVVATIVLDDALGQVAPSDGTIAWAFDDNGSFTTPTISADEMSCELAFVAVGKTGITVTVTDAAADGVAPFSLVGSIEWDPSAPTQGSVTFALSPAPTPAPGPAPGPVPPPAGATAHGDSGFPGDPEK